MINRSALIQTKTMTIKPEITPAELDALLELAQNTAREAGAVLLEHGEALRHVNFQDATDVKLKADTETEKRIRALLHAGSPYAIVGEEEGGDTTLPTQSVPYWVVDPLDGTYNYLRRNSQCCVSIGLMCGEQPLLGVIYNFNDGVLYRARKGGPLLENGVVVAPQWVDEDHEAVLSTGFPAGRDYGDEALLQFVRQVQQFKKIRMIGSAALAMAYVATGRFDVYCEEGIRLWDIAAGLALVEAAGASVHRIPNPIKPFAYNLWIAGKPRWLPETV